MQTALNAGMAVLTTKEYRKMADDFDEVLASKEGRAFCAAMDKFKGEIDNIDWQDKPAKFNSSYIVQGYHNVFKGVHAVMNHKGDDVLKYIYNMYKA